MAKTSASFLNQGLQDSSAVNGSKFAVSATPPNVLVRFIVRVRLVGRSVQRTKIYACAVVRIYCSNVTP